jgi:AcrR family transcriptional regulator
VLTKGERTRRTILDTAAKLATEEGLAPLSIGRLAAATDMSKSGLFAHFGSKEELQLATVEAATDIFAAQVTRPAAEAPTGAERLRRLVDLYLRYLAVDTFPGGCFFASVLAEIDMKPGAVRDRLVEFLGEWLDELERAVREAQAEGALDAAEDPAQVVFEIEAALMYANAQHVVSRAAEPIERARRAIDRRLGPARLPRSAA